MQHLRKYALWQIWHFITLVAILIVIYPNFSSGLRLKHCFLRNTGDNVQSYLPKQRRIHKIKASYKYNIKFMEYLSRGREDRRCFFQKPTLQKEHRPDRLQIRSDNIKFPTLFHGSHSTVTQNNDILFTVTYQKAIMIDFQHIMASLSVYRKQNVLFEWLPNVKCRL